MIIEVRIPSKTFLVGEYGVLSGGSGALVSTKPVFRCVACQTGKFGFSDIHSESPAGVFLNKNEKLFSSWHVEFEDPHRGAGGFGASSAQFLGAFVISRLLSRSNSPQQISAWQWQNIAAIQRQFEADLLNEYFSNVKMGSGADLLAQLSGSISLVQNKQIQNSLAWPLKNLAFVIFKTETKISTHEHLKEIGQISFIELQAISEKALGALESTDQDFFVSQIQKFSKELDRLDLVCAPTKKLISHLENTAGVKAVKGCGALGADTLIVFADPKAVENIKLDGEKIGLRVLATEKDIVNTGVEVILHGTRLQKSAFSTVENTLGGDL